MKKKKMPYISIQKVNEKKEVDKHQFGKRNENINERYNFNFTKNNFLILFENINYTYKKFVQILFLFISIYIPSFQSNQINLRKLEMSSKITITIKGNGTQKILSDFYSSSLPNEILINGINSTSIGNSVSDLTQEINNITMKWNSISDCQQMFRGLDNIIIADLIELNALNVEDMSYMFYECRSLEVVEINDFNSPNLKNMEYMFYSCISLKSIDFKNIDTAQVTNMDSLFYDCIMLTSIGLNNFNTISFQNFNNMFYNCN